MIRKEDCNDGISLLRHWKKIEDRSFIDYDMLCNEMIQSELLSDANKAILSQSVQAMNIGLYDLTLVGVVAVFEGRI